jgi:hypothetical protein
MVAVVRALRIMRLGNAVRNGALIFKILLNFSGAALIIVTGAKLPTAYRAVALGMIFLQFLNPVALAIYFTPAQATSGLKSLSATFALVMMPLLLWYLAIDAGVAPAHRLPMWLFEFSMNHPGEFGAWSVMYKILTPTVLATLVYFQLKYYRVKGLGFSKHKYWELFYLLNGLLRALVLIAVLELSPSIDEVFATLSYVMGLSLLVDTGIILVFATNRAVQFHRDYELTLMGPWSAELDQVVRTASLPQHFKKPHFSLADLAEASKLPTYRVTKLVSKGTDLQVRELINHFRVRHYEQLLRAQPLERKKELLAQSGFNSYAAYYAARKVKKSV